MEDDAANLDPAGLLIGHPGCPRNGAGPSALTVEIIDAACGPWVNFLDLTFVAFRSERHEPCGGASVWSEVRLGFCR
jgi:hypothetical protein